MNAKEALQESKNRALDLANNRIYAATQQGAVFTSFPPTGSPNIIGVKVLDHVACHLIAHGYTVTKVGGGTTTQQLLISWREENE